MERQLFDVNSLKIAKPCNAKWSEMSGNEKTRHCALCNKNVYNVAGMTSLEVTNLVQESEGKACMRLSRRKDGTIITRDCPVGAQGVYKRMSMAVAAGVVVLFGGLAQARLIESGPIIRTTDLIEGVSDNPVLGTVVEKVWPNSPAIGLIVTPADYCPTEFMGEVAAVISHEN